MPTIKDVAAQAGVSIKTVSRVINRDPAVRTKTRKLVEQVIAQLNYVPDSIARSLRSRRTGTIGVVTDLVATTPYSVDLISGIQDACADIGLMVLIVNTNACEDLEKHAIKTLIERKVDGILYITMRHRWLEKAPLVGEVPTVLVNCSAQNSSLPAVVPNDFQGGYTAAQYLIDRGHRDIAMISLLPSIEATQLRFNAFRQALKDYGLIYDPRLVQPGETHKDNRLVYCTREATLAILGGAPRPSAIVCGKDEIAMRVYNAVRSLGLRIPEDISIVGYDNFVYVAEGLDPPLTTVALPYYRMGREAMETLSRLINGEAIPEPLRKVSCSLVERQSCQDR